ncbi:MAG: DUF1460 domain-containing protein, partial [Muribaculaceae bacterium]|nr:DUF1460 domain-containing protein [Muribaculaceae bacterium]
MKHVYLLAAIIISLCTTVGRAAPTPTRFHNEESDTARINKILVETIASGFKTPGERTADIAMRFAGTPYVAHTLEGTPEMLTVNLDELDCTTFVETVMALSYT